MKTVLLFFATFGLIFIFLTGLDTLLTPKEPDVISSPQPCDQVRDDRDGGHAGSPASR